ncbi:MAG: methyltransferase FkbM family [Flaviaesturariibacter sp.]|nr:methyltransferase FkbM family [Flaviaesturariibacter sp.]
MKQKIKCLIIKSGYYDYLKYSHLFKLYEKFFKPQVAKNAQREDTFYQSFLRKCPLIFDIGANDGHKTEAFLKLADQVVCCEPDERNFSILKTRFRNRQKNIKLERVALSSTIGQQGMYIHQTGSAFNTLNPKFKSITEADDLERWTEKIKFNSVVKVSTVTLDILIEKYGLPTS